MAGVPEVGGVEILGVAGAIGDVPALVAEVGLGAVDAALRIAAFASQVT